MRPLLFFTIIDIGNFWVKIDVWYGLNLFALSKTVHFQKAFKTNPLIAAGESCNVSTFYTTATTEKNGREANF